MKLISGPCIIESKEVLKKSVESILESTHDTTEIDFYFKSSYKKDNRTLPSNFRSIGSDKAIQILLDIKSEYNVRVCTDFHSIEDIFKYGSDIDVIQIPAFLARQNDLIEYAVDYVNAFDDKKLFIKKPQFMSPEEVWKIFEFTQIIPNSRVFIADRGTQLGYNQVFIDPRHIEVMKTHPKTGEKQTTIVDITHPQKNYIKSIPSHVLAWRLGLASIAAGADGLFLETHPNPQDAFCDKDCQVPLGYERKIIKDCYKLWSVMIDYHE